MGCLPPRRPDARPESPPMGVHLRQLSERPATSPPRLPRHGRSVHLPVLERPTEPLLEEQLRRSMTIRRRIRRSECPDTKEKDGLNL